MTKKEKRKLKFGRYDYAQFAAYFCYAAGTVVFPIALVAISEQLGFSLAEGGMTLGGTIRLGSTVSLMTAMLACGFLGAHFGKRLTIGYAILLMGLGIGLCSASSSYHMLFIALLIAGLGEGILEGLATPFSQDLHAHEEPGRYISVSHSFWSVGIFTTVLLTGWLMYKGLSWRYMIAAVGICGILTSSLYLMPSKKAKETVDNKDPVHPRMVAAQAKTVLKTPQFWPFFAAMFFAGGCEFCLTFWSASYIQLNLGSNVWFAGLGTAIFAFGMFTSRTCWGHLIRQKHILRLVIASAVTGLPVSIALQFTNNLTVFCIILYLCGIAIGPFWPGIQSYAADSLKGTDSTMVFILLSCAGIPGCGLFTLLMGIIGDSFGLTNAMLLVPACFLIISALLLIKIPTKKIKGV